MIGVNVLRSARFWARAFGIDPLALYQTLKGLPRFVRDYVQFSRQSRKARSPWRLTPSAPCLSDWGAASGAASGHYFHQDLHVARRIFARCPRKHVDVGSRVDGFVAHVAVFREIEVFDIRGLESSIANIRFRRCDVMKLGEEFTSYCDSVSCLHALEHFGLGRYGDSICHDGYEAGFRNLCRLLQPGGVLYLSVPIGPQRVEFNGHRVFSVATVLDLASAEMELMCFSYVDDAGDFTEDVQIDPQSASASFGVTYGCGIFEFMKRR